MAPMSRSSVMTKPLYPNVSLSKFLAMVMDRLAGHFASNLSYKMWLSIIPETFLAMAALKGIRSNAVSSSRVVEKIGRSRVRIQSGSANTRKMFGNRHDIVLLQIIDGNPPHF